MIEYENLNKLNRAFFSDYKKSLESTLDSGWFILGENVEKFESEFATYCGVKHCIGVASGLDALFLSLKAFDFPKGSEIIVPSNTYIATILSILHAGLKPVLVEPNINTYNIDPEKIEGKITPQTKGIMIVHLYGKCCDMDSILKVTSKYNLELFEDCAQAHGATYKKRKAGSFGSVNAFSFYPTKNLGALGDAGAITTNNEKVAQNIKKLRNYGSEVKYYNDAVGFNSRLDEIQAGFLSIKLKKLDEINAHKRGLAKLYLDHLKDDFIKPVTHPDYFDIYHIFNVRLSKRDALKKYLFENNVKTEIHYPVPPNRQKAMKEIIKETFPISEEIHSTTLSLPISFFHTTDDIIRVIEIMNNFLK
jgi:dTDP-4-amino-4,6-dideoxygalactose transaminase